MKSVHDFGKRPLYRGDFRRRLQAELVERCRKNPRYSLRAFARSLQINHATLSSILRGRRAISPKMQKRLGLALGLNPAELAHYPARKSSPLKGWTEIELQSLDHDIFLSISDWYHDAILELTRLPDFKPSATWIAQVLSITPAEVNIAVERLVRLQLLSISKDGREWIDISGDNTTNGDEAFTNAALRRYQKQILEKSIVALSEIQVTERDHTSTIMSVRRKDLPKARSLIREFRMKLSQFLVHKNEQAEEVYVFSASLFPLTQVQRTKEKKV